ncbi:hypothetical protein D3C87_1757580 [compost metagenome]
MFSQVLAGQRQHASRTGSRVIDGAHDAGFGQDLVILDEDQVHHQADDFAWREVLAGRLVAEFRKLPDQFLEHMTHLRVADMVGVQIDVGEFLSHLV